MLVSRSITLVLVLASSIPSYGQSSGLLAGLPSGPGKHIARIKALGDNAWLELGPPSPDPKWGRARSVLDGDDAPRP